MAVEPAVPSPADVTNPLAPGTPEPRSQLRLAVPTLVLILYWVVTEFSYWFEMGMFYRFATRMVALLVLLLFFLVWGLTRRHFTFGQRCLALAIIVGAMILAGAVGDPATGTFATGMLGLPVVLSLSVLWLWRARLGNVRRELGGIAIASVLAFGTISLLRWDGLDGRQRPELSWRWTPRPEQQFLREGVRELVPAEAGRAKLAETAGDWTSFRGGSQAGVVRGVALGDWSQPPPEVWRHRVGPGWSSVIAVGDYLFTQEQRGEREAVVCYHAGTGREVWVHVPATAADRFEQSLSGTGPRATPAFHDNRLYACGAKGRLECLDAASGAEHWSVSLLELTGAAVPQWGSASSPIVVDDLVVVFAGGRHDNSLLAFDRVSGRMRWQAAGGGISYSTPEVLTIAGVRQIVMHDDAGLGGVRIEDGKLLWRHASPHAESFQPMLQPHLIAADRLVVGWDAGLLCLQLRCSSERWQADELWTSTRMKPSFNDFVIHEGNIYGLDDGILCCADLSTVQRRWKRGRYGFGQLLLLPDHNELLVVSEQGEVIRVAADPAGHRELGRFQAIRGKTWNHPLLAHGRLVIRNGEEIACFDVSRAAQPSR